MVTKKAARLEKAERLTNLRNGREGKDDFTQLAIELERIGPTYLVEEIGPPNKNSIPISVLLRRKLGEEKGERAKAVLVFVRQEISGRCCNKELVDLAEGIVVLAVVAQHLGTDCETPKSQSPWAYLDEFRMDGDNLNRDLQLVLSQRSQGWRERVRASGRWIFVWAGGRISPPPLAPEKLLDIPPGRFAVGEVRSHPRWGRLCHVKN